MNEDGVGGWERSAQAWVASLGEHGDYGRQHVLDAPMLERVSRGKFTSALDVGCGEGRFCRMMRPLGVTPVGVDPTVALIDRARALDPQGDYRLGVAEHLPVDREKFDLVVSYLSFIDIPDIARAIASMTDALRPGGSLLIANLTSFNTAGLPGRLDDAGKNAGFSIDHYMDERAVWLTWSGIRVRNWHRPLSTYFTQLLEHGLVLTHFSEPLPTGGDPERAERYRRVPWFNIMEWRKPEAR